VEILLAIETLALWPVWRWYVHRLSDQSDEAWGIVALVTAVLFTFKGVALSDVAGNPAPISPQRRGERGDFAEKKRKKNNFWESLRISSAFSAPPRLMLPAFLLLCYSLSYHFLSPLPRAAIAVTAIAATVSALRFGRRVHPNVWGVWGLLLLALPVIASLQFYLGFPMRALVARLAAPMLQINGFAVVADGASLNWNGDPILPILIDAPCSGVKMLWTGFYLTFTLACYYKLNAKRTGLACAAAFGAVIIGNTLRAAALFYVETGAINISLPDWTHEGVGVVIFAATAIAIAWMAQHIAKTNHIRYVESSSSLLHRLLLAGRGRAFRADAIGRDE
jgi:exosortase/archaeosortase family protein